MDFNISQKKNDVKVTGKGTYQDFTLTYSDRFIGEISYRFQSRPTMYGIIENTLVESVQDKEFDDLIKYCKETILRKVEK